MHVHTRTLSLGFCEVSSSKVFYSHRQYLILKPDPVHGEHFNVYFIIDVISKK